MSRNMIQQAIVVNLLVTMFLIVLLVSAPTIHMNIARAHIGLMLIAPPYQHQHNVTYEV
jgi:hypothetical protein